MALSSGAALQVRRPAADDGAMASPDRIETRDVVRRGERTIQVRVIQYPAPSAGRPAVGVGKK